MSRHYALGSVLERRGGVPGGVAGVGDSEKPTLVLKPEDGVAGHLSASVTGIGPTPGSRTLA